MSREINQETCQKCNGIGTYGNFGECFSCRGTGKKIFCSTTKVVFDGKEYKIGDELPFNNTRGKVDTGRITQFWDKNAGSYPEKPVEGWFNLNDIWYNLVVIRTGKNERYCLWKSILNRL